MDCVLENQAQSIFEVKFTRNHVVKAFTTNPLLQKPHHILNLSNLDLLSGRFPVTYFYFYQNPIANIDTNICPSSTLIDNLKRSLAITLEHYYPFAGRIVENPDTSEPQIVCDNSGALITEAEANIPLKMLDFYNLDASLQGKLVSIKPDFPLQIQVTRYTCGGASLTFTFDHALGDASAFGKFLVSWSEIARNKPISHLPNHQRRDLISARTPPCYHPSLDQTFARCTIEEIMNIPTPETLLKRLYFIDASSINRLQNLASVGGESRRTKIEAFSAYVWKIMVKAIDRKKQSTCKLGWLVDGRTRMQCRDQNSMSNYIGNVLSVAFGEAEADDLERKSLQDVASEAHEAISKVTNEAHFLDLIDWIECHRPGLMLSRVVLGQGGPALVVSSGRRFPVAEVEFGLGRPVLGTVCSTVERIGVAYMNQRPSASGDGSWTVSAILWPEFAAALEEDPLFQPMTARHLKLV
uniref:Transferase enzyme n=1 Tax=Boehmeria nivea TaxID=83906 RepID=A0A6B9S2U9_BOENI|nr:transferase enzyme [Boehmeria nivea]